MPRCDVWIKVKLLTPGAVLPRYQSSGASGMDLVAVGVDTVIISGGTAAIHTGVAVAIPEGYEGQVRPRSGLAAKHGITVLNTPGTVDSDYRGEIVVILANLGQRAFLVSPGDRIAQLVICPVARAVVEQADNLEGTARGTGGFGSTFVSRPYMGER